MSYTEMYTVPKNGPIQGVMELKNAFRGAWLVWSEMAKEYLNKGAGEIMANMQPVWDLVYDKDIPLDYRIVMMSTFDNVMVRRENFLRLAEAMEAFDETFGPSHMYAEAKKLRELVDDIDAYAVCWNQTSVCAGGWMRAKKEDHTIYLKMRGIGFCSKNWR